MEREQINREWMVEQQIASRGVDDVRVLKAMRKVPRHLFVPPEAREIAYSDCPIRIGQGQTISQPYIVGLMTALLHVEAHHRVLDVGTGSGYQAAILGNWSQKSIRSKDIRNWQDQHRKQSACWDMRISISISAMVRRGMPRQPHMIESSWALLHQPSPSRCCTS